MPAMRQSRPGSKRPNGQRPDSRPVDKVAARELELFIENDFNLYKQQHEPIIKNLLRKQKNGTYSRDKAVVAFRHLVDNGAKKYAREFSGGVSDAKIIFPGSTRNFVATRLRNSFETTAKSGGFSL